MKLYDINYIVKITFSVLHFLYRWFQKGSGAETSLSCLTFFCLCVYVFW